MKTLKKIFYVMVVFMATALLFKGCQKDPIALYPNEYNVYTNGKGGVGSAGGIVMVDDENSPLHGVAVEIPEGALDSMVEISIKLAPDSIKLPGDENAVVISFLPSGLKFKKPVGIHLPIAEQLDTTNLFGWHINYEEMVIKQIYPEIENNKAVLLTDHFSHYTVTTNGIRINKKMYYYDVNVPNYTKRVTAVIWIEGKIEGTNNWGLAGIPLVKAYYTSEYENAHDAVNYYQTNRPRATFKASLKRPHALWPFGGATVGNEYTIQVETRPIIQSDHHDIRVKVINFPHAGVEFSDLILKTDQEREDFFGGRKLCFHWYEELNSNTNYFIDGSFVIEGLLTASYGRFTAIYELSTRKERIKPADMISTNPDTNNDFIVDDTAEPPALPTVTTAPVTNITQTSATGGGNVTSQGSSAVTARGVVWSTSENPTLQNNMGSTNNGTGTGSFISNITGLSPGIRYYVRAYATNNAGTRYGNQVDFTTLDDNINAPNPPTNLYTSYTSNHGLRIYWTDNSDNETGFRIYKATNSLTNLQEYSTTPANTNYFNENNYSPDNFYAYKVTAFNDDGESQMSNLAVAPKRPINFTGQVIDGAVHLNWEFPANSQITRILVYRNTSETGPFDIIKIDDLPALNYMDTDISQGVDYFYKIKAGWSGGHGGNLSFSMPTDVIGPFSVDDDNGNGDDTEVVEVLNPATGKIWMDRNLGASRAATSSTDAEAYGDLYQWGRAADGHQKRTSGTTSTLSNSDTPGHGNFITVNNSPYDWRSPQNNNLWQGANGINNPCPVGYRLPTEAELNAERLSWSSNNAAGAFASPLKLPVAGYRSFNNGSLIGVGFGGYYWSSTVDGTYSWSLFFGGSDAGMYSTHRAYGHSVRCLKD